MKMGLIIPATEVHHVVPVESAGDRERMTRLAYDPGNLVSLCPTCHTERHRQLRSHSASEKRRRAKEEAAAFWRKVEKGGGIF
ncbi:HNH endonuclease signature motif containing protein [uncultured Alistipes sp.]|jgi:5-methylcytosine-specific restriction protein A|uniref:HNH endonuclease signature motif containing protein n=2 Tax=Bacteroidales TaxID=171549 RepID=UPI0026E45F05|nr:HNH endonuclease signature motif containing protein [uncultured Alistipes sp.]